MVSASYTLDDFSRAVRNGVAKDGRRLYPAMPYPSFTAITDDDIRALYAYFMNEVTPVNYKPPETKLPFPFNIRLSLFFWDVVFVKHERYKPHNDRDASVESRRLSGAVARPLRRLPYASRHCLPGKGLYGIVSDVFKRGRGGQLVCGESYRRPRFRIGPLV